MIVLGDCTTCKDSPIKAAICEIDKVLSDMGNIKYNNEAFYLNDKFNIEKWESLVLYKSILQKRLFTDCYTDFSTNTIISKVKQHIYGK